MTPSLHCSIITLFPDLYTHFLSTSLIHKAQEKKLFSCTTVPLLSCAEQGKRIDAPTFGHGAGMLIKPTVIERAIDETEGKRGKAYKIFFSPHGKKLDQDMLKKLLKEWQQYNHLMLLPARYEGMDARVEDYYADEVISIGDFVVMGGDTPAMLLLEGLLRLVPGVVGKAESVEHESFSTALVDYPEFTEPIEWKGLHVPEILRSGNHRAIQEWRECEAIKRTVKEHFEWLRRHPITDRQRKIIKDCIPHHYVALMHSQVILPDKEEGTSSVTSLDIHDIARSAFSYGLDGYWLVTPLEDQKKIIHTLLGFWESEVGKEYNIHRHEALSLVQQAASLDEVCKEIEHKEGMKPILIGTSAREIAREDQKIRYTDQREVWSKNRPVLILLGTGLGLASSVLNRCDYIFPPIEGFTTFNHLSVRSAAAVIFDRWLGRFR